MLGVYRYNLLNFPSYCSSENQQQYRPAPSASLFPRFYLSAQRPIPYPIQAAPLFPVHVPAPATAPALSNLLTAAAATTTLNALQHLVSLPVNQEPKKSSSKSTPSPTLVSPPPGIATKTDAERKGSLNKAKITPPPGIRVSHPSQNSVDQPTASTSSNAAASTPFTPYALVETDPPVLNRSQTSSSSSVGRRDHTDTQKTSSSSSSAAASTQLTSSTTSETDQSNASSSQISSSSQSTSSDRTRKRSRTEPQEQSSKRVRKLKYATKEEYKQSKEKAKQTRLTQHKIDSLPITLTRIDPATNQTETCSAQLVGCFGLRLKDKKATTFYKNRHYILFDMKDKDGHPMNKDFRNVTVLLTLLKGGTRAMNIVKPCPVEAAHRANNFVCFKLPSIIFGAANKTRARSEQSRTAEISFRFGAEVWSADSFTYCGTLRSEHKEKWYTIKRTDLDVDNTNNQSLQQMRNLPDGLNDEVRIRETNLFNNLISTQIENERRLASTAVKDSKKE